jgi:hAT family C-terminal dimerisation region
MEFNRVLRVLYAEYAMKYQNLQQMTQASDAPSGALGNGDDDEDSEFRQFLLEKSQPWHVKSDLDQYIDRRITLCPQGQSFDILGWWKTEGKEYHILSRIARDVLVVPISTVASESAFSTGSRVINPYRNKLDPKVVEALVCL